MNLNNAADMTQRLEMIEQLIAKNERLTNLGGNAGNLASKLGLLAGKFNPGTAEDKLYTFLRHAADLRAKEMMADARIETVRALEAIRRFRADYPDMQL